MSNKLKEKILLFRLRLKKDPDVFGELYDLYHNQIYRFVIFKISNFEEAQDITSETFLRAWQHIMNEKPVTNLSALLYSIAKNLIIDHYRKQSQFNTTSPEILDFIADGQADKILKNIEIEGDLKFLSKALLKINENYQEIIILRFIEDFSTKEVAEILDSTNGKIRVLQHRALSALREELIKMNK